MAESIRENFISYENLLELIEQHPGAIKYIENPCDTIQRIALSKLPWTFGFIKNPSIDIQIYAVKLDGLLIKRIYENGIIPNEEIKLAAVNQNGFAIQYMYDNKDKPSDIVKAAAIAQNKNAENYIISFEKILPKVHDYFKWILDAT